MNSVWWSHITNVSRCFLNNDRFATRWNTGFKEAKKRLYLCYHKSIPDFVDNESPRTLKYSPLLPLNAFKKCVYTYMCEDILWLLLAWLNILCKVRMLYTSWVLEAWVLFPCLTDRKIIKITHFVFSSAEIQHFIVRIQKIFLVLLTAETLRESLVDSNLFYL